MGLDIYLYKYENFQETKRKEDEHEEYANKYWDNFAHEMDDSSKEWYEIYKALEEYLQEKYIFELQKFYHMNCGD
jgi:hypothetical protein